MDSIPIILKKGRSFLEDLGNDVTVQRSICPREKLVSYIDGSGHLIICLISDDLQQFKLDGARFLKYEWVVSNSAEQDCIVDSRMECRSDLVAVTASLDFLWFSVWDVKETNAEEVSSVTIKVEQTAMLKKAELCTKLRKLDFPDVLESVSMLGSDKGEAFLLFNSSLVCRLVMDHEFGCIILAGCHTLQLSLLPYQDDQLPSSTGPMVECVYVAPLLFALTAQGIVFVYHAGSGACIGIVNVMDYWRYYCGTTQDFEMRQRQFEHVAVSSDLEYLAVSLCTNQVLLVNMSDYYQIFACHYHPDFTSKPTRNTSSNSESTVFDYAKEEEEEQWQSGGLAPHQSSFTGSHAWLCRLSNSQEMTSKREPLTNLQSPRLSEVGEHSATLSVASQVKKAWHEEPQPSVTCSAAQVSGETHFPYKWRNSAEYKEGVEGLSPATEFYDNRCVIPAPCQEDSKLIKLEFMCDLIVMYYGHNVGVTLSPDVTPVTGMTACSIYSRLFSYTRLPQPCWLVRSSHCEQLVYLVNDQSLSVSSFNLTQEEFVGKILMFGSASIAEEVCYLNRWDQCSLPINALETALELRQLDTLAFFLRSRDSDTNEESGQEAVLPPLPPEQLHTAVELLIGAIQRNFQKKDQSQFASQLLIMTLGFIMRMIKNVVVREEYQCELQHTKLMEGCSELDESKAEHKTIAVSVPLGTLTSYIQQLRAFLPEAVGAKRDDELVEENISVHKEELSHVTGFLDRAVVVDWDKLSPKEVIKEALLRGYLPLAQAYLLQKKPNEFTRQRMTPSSYDFSPSRQQGVSIVDALDDYPAGQKPLSLSFSHHYDASLKCVQVTAIGYLMDALQKRNMKLANSILTHIGLNVTACIRHVCLHTLNVELRNFLSKELVSQKQMSEEEVVALEYLHILEQYYPLQSYDQAHQQQTKQALNKTSFQATILPLVPAIMRRTTAIPSLGNLQDIYPETYGGDYVLHWKPVLSANATLYLQVALSALLCWDDATKQRVLFESFVLSGQTDGTECERIVKKRHILDYYVSHNDLTSLIVFLCNATPPIENPATCPAYVISCCSTLTNPTSHLKNTLLDELARNGIFVRAELGDFSSLLYRLGHVHSLFTHPHPLSKVESQPVDSEAEGCLSPSHSKVTSVEEFHIRFLSYLVENRFFSLVHHYLDYYGLALNESSITGFVFCGVGHPWVDVLLRYRLAALAPSDPNIIFEASLSCSHMLLSSDDAGQKTNVRKMFQNGRFLMALSSLMYAPVSLGDAINKSNSDQSWYAETSTIHQAIAAYPSLQAAIFPPLPTSLTPSESQDISLYELLQDTVQFDVGRLFRWQDTNMVKPHHDDAIGCFSVDCDEFPHFSSPPLAEKFALTEHLDYVYYLHRGLPSFALANFIAAKLLGHSFPIKRVNHLVRKIYRIVMHDFTNTCLASSCAALMEMLGRDSAPLRIDLQCINRIDKHGNTSRKHAKDISANGTTVNSHALVLQFCQLSKCHNDATAFSLLSQLELATQSLIKNSGMEFCGLEAEECWKLVQSFCHCHQLPPSLAFVAICAENGHWLQLLCNAQIYSIPAQKVFGVVERSFKNPNVKEHLTLAISSMDSSQPSTSRSMKSTGQVDKSRTRKRRSSQVHKSVATDKAQNVFNAQPDLRVKFYSRVGLQREVTPQPEPNEGGSEERSRENEPRRLSSNGVFEGSSPPPTQQAPHSGALLESELPSDLFSAVFKSQMSHCAWQALLAYAITLQQPFLAILAGSYEDSSAVACACCWLFSLLGPSMFDKLIMQLSVNSEVEDEFNYISEVQFRDWSTLDLSLMLLSAMQHSPSPAAYLSQAFHYFDGSSPLFHFLKFHEEFVLRNNCEDCAKYLKEFQLCMDKCKSFGFVGTIGDILWVEQVASSMASHMLALCPTPFERSHLLQLFHETHFSESFKCSVLNFSELYQMSCVLNEAGLASDAAFTIKEHFSTVPGLKFLGEIYSVRVRVDTDYVLSLLLQRGQFNIARKYASIVKSSTSQVTIKEADYNVNQLRKSSYWDFELARLNFWHQCNITFHEAGVEPESASEFFHSVVLNSEEALPASDGGAGTSSVTALEKSLLLALALKWRQQSDVFNSDQIEELEKEIWLSHIHSTVEELENSAKPSLHGSPLPFLSEVDHSTAGLFSLHGHTALLSSLSVTAQQKFKGRRQLTEFLLPDNVSVALEGKSRTTLTHKEGEAFDMMLGRLMNAGLLCQARQLSALFEHDSPDLTIVLCCIQLCQGKLTTSQLTEGVLSLVSTRLPRHLNDPSAPMMDDPTHTSHASEIIRMLNTLSDRATYAQECCNCIITCFRIALALNVSYALVINTEPYETLVLLLSSKASDKYTLASKFIATCNLESKDVAAFLSECIATSLQAKYGGPGNPSDSPKARVFQHNMSSSQFHEMAQLSSDSTLLGNLLLNMSKSLMSVDQDSKQSIAIQIELLIRSHDCYTLGCSVDGISDVLVVAQNWVQKLVQGKHFKLMVRLLTGISRYHEMGYIIGLLIEHDQFESLVNKGVEKEEQLRVALIEYLRKHGSDNEKLQMVALNFGMPRELAKTMEDQARKELLLIKSKQLANNETVMKLKKIFDGFRDAAKTYSKEGCLNSAEYCLSQARLVALQLSVLNQNKQVINLQPKEVLRYMEEQPFSESLIVSDAYKQCIWADWVNPLYRRVVIGGDFRYFGEYKTAFPLTPNIFTELAGKYQRDREKSPEAANNMWKLLADLKHISLKQKIARDLCLNELVQTRVFEAGYISDIQKL